MAFYRDFNKSDSVAYNIAEALRYCKENRETSLVFDKNEYHLNRALATEAFYSVSNHGDPALKRIAFLLRDMKDFTIDGSGSHFILDDILNPVVIDACENVTVRNMSFSSVDTQNAETEVVASGDNWFFAKVRDEKPFYILDGELYFGDRSTHSARAVIFDVIDGKTLNYRQNCADIGLSPEGADPVFTKTADGLLYGRGNWGKIPEGSFLLFLTQTRCSAGLFLKDSVNTKVQNVTFYSGIGMGVIAQNCDGVELDRFNVRNPEGRHYSINADATHFVHCRGRIHIHDCFFEGQLDDALNVHSIYLSIVEKRENSILVRYCHPESLGIDIVRPGCVVETCPPDSLIPTGKTYHITEARCLNLEYTELFFREGVEDFRVGDNINEISFVCDILFEKNTVRNNRARGMLLAGNGKTIIRDNIFHTPGPAILFESNGDYWFEAGGVKDVEIYRNEFTECLFSGWGEAVIWGLPRKKTEAGKYYHGRIAVYENRFTRCSGLPVWMNSVREFVCQNNTFDACESDEVRCEHCNGKE